jgi:hypothetical protein
MVYLGRIVGAGSTKNNESAIVYAVSGRSEGSKARTAHLYPTRVFIGSSITKIPYDRITEIQKASIKQYLDGVARYAAVSSWVKDLTDNEKATLKKQIENEQFIFYDGIKIPRDSYCGIVSNGLHTEGIARTHYIDKVLLKWGPELDGPNNTPLTPRIAGYVLDNGIGVEGIYYDLGIISKPKEPRVMMSIKAKPSLIEGLSTYAGNPDSPAEIVINHDLKLLTLPAEGITAQQLADDLFDWVDKKFVVCTAAAVFDSKTEKWILAVRNLHKV